MNSFSRNLIRIQELETLLKEEHSKQDEIDLLTELAWELRINQPKRAAQLARQAHTLSESEDKSYLNGVAASLVTLAFTYLQAGKLQDGTKICLEALKYVKDHPPTTTIARIWYTLAENSFFIRNFPLALTLAEKAQELARELGMEVETALATDTIASSWGILGKFDKAISTHTEAIAMFQDQDEIYGWLRARNNLAMTLYGKGEHEKAQAEIQNVLNDAKKHNSKYDLLNIYCTAAQIAIDLDQLDEAEQYLDAAFRNAEVLENMITYHVYVMMEWARLSLKRNEPQKARSHLLQAIVVAEENDQLFELVQCYEMLADIAEKDGDLEKAKGYRDDHKFHREILEKKLHEYQSSIEDATT